MIRILFFAQLREQLNCGELDWPLLQTMSVEELRNALVQTHPHWQEFLAHKNILCAVNQTITKPTELVKSGDEVAFFPPVTGG